MHKIAIFIFFFIISIPVTKGASGKWQSRVTGGAIAYKLTESKKVNPDFHGDYPTIVYLENLNIKKIGRNTNSADVAWLLSQGYRVIELDYKNNANATAISINADIIAINDSIAAGSFCGHKRSSRYQSYVLFEGYRISRNVPYFNDDPTVYNTPAEYKFGDMLQMDIVYPANAAVKVPVILSFSYSNSYATYDAETRTLTTANKDQRLNLAYTLAGFDDSFLEGAPANGIAWAIADHPKYCPWGKGRPADGRNDTYKSYQSNPDAARKVKSAVRTLRSLGAGLGLSEDIGIYGFSRGSTAGSMAVGDRTVPGFENAGFHIGVDDNVQAAALGPGVFDYTIIYNNLNDGDVNLETRCPWAWGSLETNLDFWQTMGAAYLVESADTAPVLFFYNTTDERYYQDQVASFKFKLDSLNIPNTTLVDYGKGHSVPQTKDSLRKMYSFFSTHLHPPKV
ncbi:alpha/beta hydrolase family protein [Arcticibacter sp.]|jgi:hypothetical protein|uniref:alpha/beta hydrolase family protein n=1 Tax=Arcticibacter sp. TaxID=1872630 RepID=UPI00388DB4D3